MYKGIKSMLEINGMLSGFFNCNIGVRQGENLSPFLFSMYINDIEEFLVEKKMYKGYIVYQMILRLNSLYILNCWSYFTLMTVLFWRNLL